MVPKSYLLQLCCVLKLCLSKPLKTTCNAISFYDFPWSYISSIVQTEPWFILLKTSLLCGSQHSTMGHAHSLKGHSGSFKPKPVSRVTWFSLNSFRSIVFMSVIHWLWFLHCATRHQQKTWTRSTHTHTHTHTGVRFLYYYTIRSVSLPSRPKRDTWHFISSCL